MSNSESCNATARAQALAAVDTLKTTSTAILEYQSHGRVLVIGPHDTAMFALSCLNENLNGTILQTDFADDPDHVTVPVAGRTVKLVGHLGAFTVTLGEKGEPSFQTLSADLILDLSPEPLLSMAIKPPGYHCSSDAFPDIEIEVQNMGELVGTFEKPRYFDYDATICAHGRSGQPGCNNCIEACPTDAITSLKEMIEVDPFRCQGGGICATACPTGAIRYVYPDLKDQLSYLKSLLHAFLDNGGTNPVVVFAAEADVEQLSIQSDHVFVVPVEELASVGLEVWFSALAYGANSVVLAGDSVPAEVEAWLSQQISIGWTILSALGLSERTLRRVSDNGEQLSDVIDWQLDRRASYVPFAEKRNMLFAALDTLAGGNNHTQVDLPVGAPFGRIVVDNSSCTLCMACTSVCPASAVVAGGDKPALLFYEENCVQCGICQNSCPENAIQLQPRINLDRDQRRRGMIVNEQEPFHCVTCGKPFAIRNIIDTMLSKLTDHPMFQTERAKRRLMMCDDCRVVDVVQDEDMMNPED